MNLLFLVNRIQLKRACEKHIKQKKEAGELPTLSEYPSKHRRGTTMQNTVKDRIIMEADDK